MQKSENRFPIFLVQQNSAFFCLNNKIIKSKIYFDQGKLQCVCKNVFYLFFIETQNSISGKNTLFIYADFKMNKFIIYFEAEKIQKFVFEHANQFQTSQCHVKNGIHIT